MKSGALNKIISSGQVSSVLEAHSALAPRSFQAFGEVVSSDQAPRSHLPHSAHRPIPCFSGADHYISNGPGSICRLVHDGQEPTQN